MKTVLIRSKEEKRGTEPDIRRLSLGLYIKATEWSLTISGHTEQVAWTMFQLKLFLSTRIV
jgi:hypothetical protein